MLSSLAIQTLTLSRAAVAPLTAHLIIAKRDIAALMLVVFALATDILDGWAARKFKKVSNLGKVMDPAADKFFVLLALYALFVRLHIPLNLFYAFLIRDGLLGVGALVLWTKKRITLPASWMGKAAMGLHMTSITLMIVSHTGSFPLNIKHEFMQAVFGIIFPSAILASCASFYYYVIDFVLILWGREGIPDKAARFLTYIRLVTPLLLVISIYQRSPFWSGIVVLTNLAANMHRFKNQPRTERILNLGADKMLILAWLLGGYFINDGFLYPLEGFFTCLLSLPLLISVVNLFRSWKKKSTPSVSYWVPLALYMLAVSAMIQVIKHSSLQSILKDGPKK